MLRTLSLLLFCLPVPGRLGAKRPRRIPLPRKKPAAATRIACAKTSSPMNSKWRPVCRRTAIASATAAARFWKATSDSRPARGYSAALSSAGDAGLKLFEQRCFVGLSGGE